eukprot:TRINITY_DN3603_c0_g1_i2.p1 TRINITY_DN3603_c0_g1~~TRINITY_DN3603_c0_g1_i2.p1  ORF type:complete len:379 (+),score=15.68 TRINITY_DN3603_c0_g1_i2:454-1590(+)
MFVGELCCIVGYFYVRYRQRKEYGNELTPDEKEASGKGLILNYNPLWLAIPALFDCLASTLMYVALTSVDASVLQIINCTILVWIAIFSIIYLKRRYSLSQYIGLAALFAGVSLVAVGAMIRGGAETGQTKPFGIICAILSVMFFGLQMVAEEKLLSIYYAEPLKMVGIEGGTGLAVYTVALFVLYYIPCTPDPDTAFCPYGVMEDVPRALRELGSNWLLVLTILATITSLGGFNYFGVSLTKYASATHRGAVNAVRPFTVWIVCLLVQWETFFYLQLIGYLISVYGMLVYYGILPLNIFNLCKSKPEPESEDTAKMIEPQHSSLAKAYDNHTIGYILLIIAFCMYYGAVQSCYGVYLSCLSIRRGLAKPSYENDIRQ